MAGSINFAGIASGIDTTSIINELISIDKQPVTTLQAEQTTLQTKETAYNGVSTNLIALQAASYPLNQLRAFNLVTANSSASTVATVSALTGAQTGTNTINVTNLATSQVIGSGVQSSQTAPINQSGQIIINGKAISYQAADSLQTLASEINAAQAGVTASILSPSSGKYYLTLGSTNSGTAGQISISDAGSGNLLGANGPLALFGTTSSFANPISGGGNGSALFSDSATSVATLEGQTTPAVGNVQFTINGQQQNVSIDLSQSLSQIATAINNVSAGAAKIVSVTNPLTNASEQQLQLSSSVTGFVDNNNVLANLGIVKNNLATGAQLTAAQDANYTIDNLPASSSSNTITSAISGVTINLVGTGSTTLTVAPDTTTIATNINNFVTAYNTVVSGIASQATYDATSKVSGPLFGDPATQSILQDLSLNINGAIPGLPASTSALSQIGITTDSTGQLTVNSATLNAALASNLSGVAKLFQASGSATNPNVQFVSATSNTVPTSGTGYAVHVFTPATQATYTSASIQTQPLATDETLTFAGSLFGTSGTASPLRGPTIILPAGASAADIVSEINADPIIGKQISASLAPANGADPGGELRLASKNYGAASDFSVVSTASIGPNTSGLGTTTHQVIGTDVVGTINGEAATGAGQYLTGSQQGGTSGVNGKALGLQLRVAATAPGDYGNVTFTSGVANLVSNYVTTQTDPYSGALTNAVTNLQSNYTSIQTQIDSINANLATEQAYLKQEFTAMETSVAQLKAASAGLATLGVTSNSTSSSGSSSSSSSSGSSSTSSTLQ